MKVYAFVGPSGTGKSHRAQMVAKMKKAECIIDDAILIKGNKVICKIMGDETVLDIDGNYLVENKEATILGYVISEGFWPDEDTVEQHLDGVSRKFKASTYYSKVD